MIEHLFNIILNQISAGKALDNETIKTLKQAFMAGFGGSFFLMMDLIYSKDETELKSITAKIEAEINTIMKGLYGDKWA